MTEQGLVWSEGRIVPAEQATVSALDRGFLLGDGLYETMRCRDGRVFRLDAHLARLERGARRAGIAVPEGTRGAVEELASAARGAGGQAPGGGAATPREWAVRLTLTRGVGRGGLEAFDAPATLTAWLRPLPAESAGLRARGLRLQTASHRVASRSVVAGLKTLGYLPHVLAVLEARALGADDALLLDEHDRVAEASASNVFWVAPGGELRTPSEACGILPGITRALVVGLAREHGITVEEGEWGADELSGAHEAFTTSSLRGVAPVLALDGTAVGDGEPGPLTRALRRAHEDLVAAETG